MQDDHHRAFFELRVNVNFTAFGVDIILNPHIRGFYNQLNKATQLQAQVFSAAKEPLAVSSVYFFAPASAIISISSRLVSGIDARQLQVIEPQNIFAHDLPENVARQVA